MSICKVSDFLQTMYPLADSKMPSKEIGQRKDRQNILFLLAIRLGTIFLVGIALGKGKKTSAGFAAFLGHDTSMNSCSQR